jgi:hypothetical protein
MHLKKGLPQKTWKSLSTSHDREREVGRVPVEGKGYPWAAPETFAL